MNRSSTAIFDTIGAAQFQMEYLEFSEGTDWNCYNSDKEEHVYLKKNIGYALFGPPTVNNVLGYPEPQAKKICEIYETICNNHYLKNTSELHIRIIYIYICFGNDKVGDGRVPLFVLKKCVESRNPCIIFIDDHCRVYEGWTAYLENNKLPNCLMVCPAKGKYTGSIYINEKGEEDVNVKLEYHQSPASNISNMVLNVVDTTGTVVSIGTTLIVGASTLIAVSPPVLAAAGIAGLGTGMFAVGRSVMSLIDRNVHQQSIGLNNSEARGHWFTTAIGALSATAAGATRILTNFTRSGAVIGEGTQMAFNTLSAVNLLGSTANCGISIFNFYGKWTSEENITFMDVFQLSSSILFFQMSVMNFRTASAIIQETQTSVISEYQDTLRSNRHRKIFRKTQLESRRLNGEVVGNAEIIKGIKHIANPNEYFAGLVKVNKDLNKIGARYTINAEGQILINSVTVIDPVQFNDMNVNNRRVTLNNLPTSQPNASFSSSTNWLNSKIADITSFCNNRASRLPEIGNIREYSAIIALLTKDFSKWATDGILIITTKLLNRIRTKLGNIKEMHPLVNVIVICVQFVVEYLKRYAKSLHLEITETIRIITKDLQNGKHNNIIDSFNEWWNNQTRKFYSIPNEYIVIKNRQKSRKICKTCQGHYFVFV